MWLDDFLQFGRADLLRGYRFEVKIPLDIGQFAELRQCLYQNGLFPRRAYDDRLVNSIYMDTFDRVDYTDNTSGIGDRIKTRFRWYGSDLSQLVLERKIKTNKASRKEIFSLKNLDNLHPGKRAEADRLLQQNRDVLPLALIGPIFPALEVNYKRQYYTLDTDLRMTIDTDQMFKGLRPSPQSSFSKSPVHTVVEFKFPAEQRLRMQQMLQNLPFRVFRHSKYVVGTEVSSR